MKIRTVKIAASAVCLLTFALLVALWVRSYWISDSVTWNGWWKATVFSMKGQIRVSTSDKTFIGSPLLQWQTTGTGTMMPDGIGSWYFRLGRQSMFVVFPHRLPIAIFVLLAVAPWIRWSYSLRTVLITTAVVALLLEIALSRTVVQQPIASGFRCHGSNLKSGFGGLHHYTPIPNSRGLQRCWATRQN